MIKVLLIESDTKNRDIVTVGLENFQAFEVDYAEDAWGVEMARENSYDLILVNLVLADHTDGMELVKQIREFEEEAEIVVMTRGKSSRLLSKEKSASNIFSLLSLPIDEQAFFKTIVRVKDRITNKSKGK